MSFGFDTMIVYVMWSFRWQKMFLIYFCMCSAIVGFMMSTNGRILTKSLSVLSMLGSIKHLDICEKKIVFGSIIRA